MTSNFQRMGYDIVSSNRYLTFSRRGESCYDSHSRGLPGTVWTQETNYLTLKNFERDIDYGRVRTVIFRHMLNLDQLLTPISACYRLFPLRNNPRVLT